MLTLTEKFYDIPSYQNNSNPNSSLNCFSYVCSRGSTGDVLLVQECNCFNKFEINNKALNELEMPPEGVFQDFFVPFLKFLSLPKHLFSLCPEILGLIK